MPKRVGKHKASSATSVKSARSAQSASKKYIPSALKFSVIASKIPLFIKNINGATKIVTATQRTGIPSGFV
ncbi:MAG: hypothetical protein LBE92_21925 [Chryseobacterium sp.]|uniref:hypothetical protein n=1 Tax=Chryseobacterium sp. TaxID=1871047 RepID=UPI00282C2901|nr:hypothetical protein [Chryseobacterium sp.]MDR2238782.1 hypothetical protein [Chryseobacterium sp.]